MDDYNSPLDSYPLLRSQVSIDAGVAASKCFSSSSSQATLFSTQGISPSSSSTSVSSISIDWPDLKPLKLAVACQSFDSEKRICQFEVPGGGECRDAHCEDMHIGRVSSIEPTGTQVSSFPVSLTWTSFSPVSPSFTSFNISILPSSLFYRRDTAQYLFNTLSATLLVKKSRASRLSRTP